MRVREMNDYDLMHAIVDSGRAVLTAFVERGTAEAKPVETELNALAGDLGDTIVSVVDVAENPSIARKFGSSEAPCVALFRDGRHLATCSSGLSRAELAAFVERTLRD